MSHNFPEGIVQSALDFSIEEALTASSKLDTAVSLGVAVPLNTPGVTIIPVDSVEQNTNKAKSWGECLSATRELELRLKGKQAEYDDLLAYTLKLEQGIRSESAYAHMHSVALDEQNLKQEADKFKRMGDTLIALIRP